MNELSLEAFKALPQSERSQLGNLRRMSPMDQARFQVDECRLSATTVSTVADTSMAASDATIATVARIAENWFLASGFVTRINEARAGALNPTVARILDNYAAASGAANR